MWTPRRAPGRAVRLLVVAAVVCAGVAGGVMTSDGQALRPGQPAPEIAGERWINSTPLTMAGLRGRVVLVEFWTYG
jgi:hypothetical protein